MIFLLIDPILSDNPQNIVSLFGHSSGGLLCQVIAYQLSIKHPKHKDRINMITSGVIPLWGNHGLPQMDSSFLRVSINLVNIYQGFK